MFGIKKNTVETKTQKLRILFEKWAGEDVESISILPQSGSYREYYRIIGETRNVLGVYNADKKENRAFYKFTEHFLSQKLPVPQVYIRDDAHDLYLIEDFGDETLFSFLTKTRIGSEFPENLIVTYKKVLEALPLFQIQAGKNLEYSVCYPRAEFDKQSMMWDLNYFKYYFLKLAKISFDEQHLEDDFQTFSNYLLQSDCKYFLYRDFQSRNIMVKDDNVYFIDYQGGRKGALQYDLASLLYDAKADIPQNLREELLDYYIDVTDKILPLDRKKFKEYYYGYVLIRIMQAMGAYGFRGFYEKKEHFLKSIPYAVSNLEFLLKNVKLPVEIPALWNALEQIVLSEELKKYANQEHEQKIILTVSVTSFSFKKGIPEDTSGNGGGFVFDCRIIHNPGRYDEYKNLNGMDAPVIAFLDKEEEMKRFLKSVFALAEQSVEKYMKRNFTHLMFNFGCTGGQHRSVYSAEKLAKHLREKYDVNVVLKHREHVYDSA
ncbi:MAG: phosphotransferase enzyme family protein [Bacteroidetes bacterium RIFOXYA12_FULL_35_11]|nr:MAG: phosphotransferase enzyme family protein [Bacteroidetes bacterium GWF2_35_48]OFY78903.1 MAG: phosphotransferase enzyme family protein [Bacteroidetes bacterium RIFOXYA12_FULL_35_11]HBX49659.1 phosphotransferase enzyme family protein [Bacteroidales bacterium]